MSHSLHERVNDPVEISVEVVLPPDRRGELGSPLVERLVDRIDDVTEAVDEIARRVAARFHQLTKAGGDWELDEVTLDFSLDIEAQAGVVVARATTSAAFAVSLKWSARKSVT